MSNMGKEMTVLPHEEKKVLVFGTQVAQTVENLGQVSFFNLHNSVLLFNATLCALDIRSFFEIWNSIADAGTSV